MPADVFQKARLRNQRAVSLHYLYGLSRMPMFDKPARAYYFLYHSWLTIHSLLRKTMVPGYAVHIQGSKPVPPSQQTPLYVTGCATKASPPFFYIRVRVNSVQARINVFVVFFCTWVTRKVEAPERTKRKHCTIMCASIALVNFSFFFSFTVHSFSLVFSWWASFLLSLSCVVLDGRTVTQKRLWRFFLHKWRREAIIIFLVELRVSVVLK